MSSTQEHLCQPLLGLFLLFPAPSTLAWKLSQEVIWGNGKTQLLSFLLFLRNHVLYYLISNVLKTCLLSFVQFFGWVRQEGKFGPYYFMLVKSGSLWGSFDSFPLSFSTSVHQFNRILLSYLLGTWHLGSGEALEVSWGFITILK